MRGKNQKRELHVWDAIGLRGLCIPAHQGLVNVAGPATNAYKLRVGDFVGLDSAGFHH